MVTRTRTRRTTMSRSEAGRKGALARWGKISRTSSARTSARKATTSRSRTASRAVSRSTRRSSPNSSFNFTGSNRQPTWGTQRPSSRSRTTRTNSTRTSSTRRSQPSWNIQEDMDFNYENPSRQGFGRNSQRGYQREPVLSYWELEDARYQPSNTRYQPSNARSTRRNSTSTRFSNTQRRTTRSRTR